jgi:peptidoglycan/LPS O-acetylase OafA/YrhL
MKSPKIDHKLEKLEALRGFSALYVLLFHLLPQKIYLFGINVGILFRFGSEAVILFFILSGFVIKYSWEKSEDKSFRNYFGRRFLRIYIPLIFIFILGYLLQCSHQGNLADPDWTNLIGNIFMLQDVISQKPNVIAAAYMGNGLLWSLSYEWWFYMIFPPLSKYIDNKKINVWVQIIVISGTVSYLIYPFIINRILMYFGIWWIGAKFAEIYLNGESYTFKAIKSYGYFLATVIALLGLNLYLNFSYTKIYSYPFVAYPFVELRHFVFAFLVLYGAIIWNKYNWFGFDSIFGLFKHLAPISYVIYISHHYLVIEATYLRFINNKIIEYTIYIIMMLLFSNLLEAVIYPKIKNRLMVYFLNPSLKKQHYENRN